MTESESDDPDSYCGMTNILSESGKKLIQKKRKAIRRRAQRLKFKTISEQRFLSRRVSPRVSKIEKECPNIGTVVEEFVQKGNVGADAWRRTGVLTFDGNIKLSQKVTYNRIKKHLEEVYHRHFSYGSVVELCVARNRRRRSAKRYKGLAKVISRRARKGFNIRYNPDSHWSGAFYKGLNSFQFADGTDMLVINRDDAAGFRLDTLTTSKQYTTPVVCGHDVLTTRTDYVNKHPSVIQTTSYNFPRTMTTPEVCVGVVKAPGLHQKNPVQHYEDLCMLEQMDDLRSAFVNPAGENKSIDCIRVDGASDEGPSHLEIQFLWTEWHWKKKKIATLVTTRCSGCSYMNRVELQNGCLSRGHSNTFIPSTIAGTNLDPSTGKLSEEKVKENLSLAIDAYISRVDGCPCGSTTIKLYKGPDSTIRQRMRSKLTIFLKGSNKKKEELRSSDPELFKYFSEVWSIRNSHMVDGLPSQYVFYLLCCYDKECLHPLCKLGHPPTTPTWYPGGLMLTHLPLPVADPEHTWGSPCNKCQGFCPGHYKLEAVDIRDATAMEKVLKPPSTVLKEMFNLSFTDDDIEAAARAVLLSVGDVKIWFEHLQTVEENRRRGATKAAATRRAKQTRSTQETEPEHVLCGVCGKEYEEETIEPELWIACDHCNLWFHCTCEGLVEPPQDDTYTCSKCSH